MLRKDSNAIKGHGRSHSDRTQSTRRTDFATKTWEGLRLTAIAKVWAGGSMEADDVKVPSSHTKRSFQVAKLQMPSSTKSMSRMITKPKPSLTALELQWSTCRKTKRRKNRRLLNWTILGGYTSTG
ncbi:hypothetical protein PMIN03_011603 [Paraphaeosphaeria minitans]